MAETPTYYYETEIEWKGAKDLQLIGAKLPAIEACAPPEFKGREGVPRLPNFYSPSPNTSQLAARMKARRTLRSLGEGGWKGFGEFREDTSELCSEELHLRYAQRGKDPRALELDG